MNVAQPRNPQTPLGFPPQGTIQRPAPVARPTPLPKRPKGRWFVGVILLGICGLATYNVWHTYFRYRAYGTVTGRIIELSPPWQGVVHEILVREGDTVRQGQLLMSVNNTELQQRHAQLGDEIVIAQANLQAEIAKLKWQVAFSIDQGQGVVATYYEMWGRLLQEQAKLEEITTTLKRAARLYNQQAMSTEEIEQLRSNKKGLEEKIAKLKESLDELKKRAELASALLQKGTELSKGHTENGYDQLKPSLARIEALQAERSRIQERLDQGRLCASANGLVVKIHRFAGESCKAAEPVLSILEEGSLQVVLFLPQKSSTLLAEGDGVNVVIEPHAQRLNCEVVRLGEKYEPAPDNIKRHYAADEKLLPVYLQPKDETVRWMALRVGGVVELPYSW